MKLLLKIHWVRKSAATGVFVPSISLKKLTFYKIYIALTIWNVWHFKMLQGRKVITIVKLNAVISNNRANYSVEAQMY